MSLMWMNIHTHIELNDQGVSFEIVI